MTTWKVLVEIVGRFREIDFENLMVAWDGSVGRCSARTKEIGNHNN